MVDTFETVQVKNPSTMRMSTEYAEPYRRFVLLELIPARQFWTSVFISLKIWGGQPPHRFPDLGVRIPVLSPKTLFSAPQAKNFALFRLYFHFCFILRAF